MTLSLNPGFALLLAALVVWALPRPARFVLMLAAALVALALPLAPDFGDHAAFGQFGLRVVPLRLDGLSQWFGLAAGALAVMAALASLTRDRRAEDALLCALTGGAMAATFAGDLVTFVAAASITAFTIVAMAFAEGRSAAARATARRITVWMAVATLLLTAGAGVFLGEAKSVRFEEIGADNLGGVFVLLGLSVLIGAPVAHVWLRDAAVRLSPIAAPFALAAAPLLSVYGLARAFPVEPALCGLGAIMALGAAPLALSADDQRRALAYAAVAVWGMAAALIGVSDAVGVAGGSALAFLGAIGLAAAMLAACSVFAAGGSASATALGDGEGRYMPVTATLFTIAALSLVGWPGLGGQVGLAYALDVAADFGPAWLWPALLAAIGALAACVAVRLPLLLIAAPKASRPDDGAESPILALVFAAAVLVGIGAQPDWLFRLLPPTPVRFDPHRPAELLIAVQIIAAGGAAWALARTLRLAPRGGGLVDIDLVWRALYPPASRISGRIAQALGAWGERSSVSVADAARAGFTALAEISARWGRASLAPGIAVIALLVAALALMWAVS